MKITVFTPTYNRGYIIEKLYGSLQKQTFRDFEWVVVDDGSTDHTEEIFRNILSEENFFPVVFIKTPNGGKHRAINKGISVAKGEMFYIVDSDDFLPDDALEIICKVESTIPECMRNTFIGVCGLRSHPNGKALGESFEGYFLDITALERAKFNILGDKAEVFYTDILKKYPFPEFEGEKFVTECVVWDKIAFDGYKFRFFNDTIYYCDYLEDGLTHNYDKVYRENPKSYGLYIYQSIRFGKLTENQIRYEYRKYMQTHCHKYSLKTLAKWLYVQPKVIRKEYIKAKDFKHLPNRVLIKLLGQQRYDVLKGKMKKK